MLTYYLKCNSNIKSIDLNKVRMTNEVIRAKSRCDTSMAKKS